MKERIALSALAFTIAATHITSAQEQDQPRKPNAKQQAAVQRLVTAGADPRLEPLVAQHDGEHLGERRVVVDDEDPAPAGGQ